MKKECSEQSDFVKIAGTIGGILLVIIVLFLVLAKEMMVTVLPTINLGFCGSWDSVRCIE